MWGMNAVTDTFKALQNLKALFLGQKILKPGKKFLK